MALSMFDMVLHDALAREAGVPLWRLLGGNNAPLPTYHSCGLGIAEPADVAREAKEMLVEHGGFNHVKLRMGRPHAAGEVAAYKAVRDAVGPDIAISCDFNQGLPSATALETCRAIDGLGLAWIEEPVAYDDYDTQARLATKLATPIQIGENWWSWRVGKAAIEMGACDYIMPDLLRIGGVTGWMRLARVAEARAVPFSSHLSPDYSAHVLAATPTKHWLEFMDWGQDLIRDPAAARERLHHPARHAAAPGSNGTRRPSPRISSTPDPYPRLSGLCEKCALPWAGSRFAGDERKAGGRRPGGRPRSLTS